MTGPAWEDVNLEAVQDRLARQLGLVLEDDEDLITLIACLVHDLILTGDVSRHDDLRMVRETVRDWLGS